MSILHTPSPMHVKRLAALAQAAQSRSLIHVQHSHVGNNNEHIAKLRATSPELGQAATRLASAQPWRPPNTDAQRDAARNAHKAMMKGVAFNKAAKGLAPQGKRARKAAGYGME